MKRMLSSLLGSTLITDDGPAGTVQDFYFDDITWMLRYAVVRAKHGPEVLVPAHKFLPREWDFATLPVRLSYGDLEQCPPADAHRPVSRQKMDAVRAVMPWPEAGAIGVGINLQQLDIRPGDPHLRSFRVVRRYRVDSSTGMVGTVTDFAVEDQRWAIHGLVVKTGHWTRRRTVLASLTWAQSIDWASGTIWTETHPLDWHTAPTLGWQTSRRPS